MQVVPIKELDEAGVAASLAVQREVDIALDPELPATTAAEFRALITDDRTDGNRHDRLAVIDDDGTIDVVAHFELESGAENSHFSVTEIFGAAAHPESGRAAVAAIIDIAAADGRTSLMGWALQGDAEDSFWMSLGATHRYTEQTSDLDLTAVDGELMARWIARRDERAADVELFAWVERCPDELLDAYVVSVNAMNDAPKGDIDIHDSVTDGDDIRIDEEARALIGMKIHTILALTHDGEPVGRTAIHENVHRPTASWQWDTVTLAPHRHRGIGRWLKAEMWRRLRDEAPHITRLRTGNASNNQAMLAINMEMGFRPSHRYGAWQAELSVYREALDRP